MNKFQAEEFDDGSLDDNNSEIFYDPFPQTTVSKNPDLLKKNSSVRCTELLPFGVRCVIYSFIDLMFLLNNISKLSRNERLKITTSEVLDQPRCLKIHIK